MEEKKAYTVDELAELLGKLIGIAEGAVQQTAQQDAPRRERTFVELAASLGIDEKLWYTAQEVGQVLDCPPSDIYMWVSKGLIKHQRTRGGKRLRFMPEWVDEYLAHTTFGGEEHAA